MRFIEYVGERGPRLGAVREDEVFDVAGLGAGLPGRMLDLIRAGEEGLRRTSEALAAGPSMAPAGRLDDLSIGAPLPNPPKLLCVAANYSEHIVECGFRAPEATARITPQFFCKFPSTAIIGPKAAVELTPRNVALDWELELAVVLGRRGKYIPLYSALEYVFGYSIMNDLSERKLNSNLKDREVRPNDNFFDWLNGKWFDGYAPLGPVIATTEDIPDPQVLELRLDVNGETMQRSTTAKMISTVAQLIAYISEYVTLEPGDIIATGTPEGTGVSRGQFLKPGDVMRGLITGLGCLETPVIAAPGGRK